ncbi:MAG: ribonucleotide-diphosphate reductase subunit alpha, partial [Deinococcus sp.]|nr:ribonucleotide-diphosphate reductase subunit alpha [Deinococcus sp.]
MSLREVNATEADAQGLELTPNALLVLRKRYLRRGPSGEPIETPLECFQRVARAIASVDSAYGAGKKQLARTEEEFFRLLARIEFFPNSPTWTGAGTPLGQLAACFVLPVDDDLGSIYDLIKYCALIHQTGGGTGFALSRLRPKNAYIRTSGGRSSGPVSFLRAISQAIDVVSQGGTRRGANMG